MSVYSSVNCKLIPNAIVADNGAGDGPVLLLGLVLDHKAFVTGGTKAGKSELPLFVIRGCSMPQRI